LSGDLKPYSEAGPEIGLAVVVRGYHNGHVTTLKRQPGEGGMRLPLTSGIQRGTGQKTGDRRNVDARNLAF